MAILEAGTILLLETGEYSDHSTHGPFIILKAFDQSVVSKEYKDSWTPTEEDFYDRPDPHGFIAWLATQGYIEDAPKTFRWHVGSYGEFTPEPFA